MNNKTKMYSVELIATPTLYTHGNLLRISNYEDYVYLIKEITPVKIHLDKLTGYIKYIHYYGITNCKISGAVNNKDIKTCSVYTSLDKLVEVIANNSILSKYTYVGIDIKKLRPEMFI